MKILPQRTFTWILLLFVVYAYVSYEGYDTRPEKEPITSELPPKVNVETSDEATGVFDKAINEAFRKIVKTETGKTFVEALAKKRMQEKLGNKDVYAAVAQDQNKLHTLDREAGTGPYAHCGSVVKLNYEFFTADNLSLDKNDAPLDITIGDKSFLKGLEYGVVGMRKGGKRKIAVPSTLAYDDPVFHNSLVKMGVPLLIEVEMIDIKNGVDSKSHLIITDTQQGTGTRQVVCGDEVTIKYKADNNIIGQATIIVGDGNAPIGLEAGLLGMKIGGNRGLLIPKDLLQARGAGKLAEKLYLQDDKDYSIAIDLIDININSRSKTQ